MNNVSIRSAGKLGEDFIPNEYLINGKDEYHFRNKQTLWPETNWRKLIPDEIDQLVANGNWAEDWNFIFVAKKFDINQIKNNKFYGLVRIGKIQDQLLEHRDMRLPIGITNSLIVSCDIGDDPAIHNVYYLAHYIIGDRCFLFDIDEMYTTSTAKFGNGVIKKSEAEDKRIWISLMNEAGGRRILSFEGINTADAYMWAKYRDDKNLQDNLVKLTQDQFDIHYGFYGIVGSQSVIKNSRSIIDVQIGEHILIKGVNRLENLTINSSREEPTFMGEGVDLTNGIVGFGCNVVSGSKAERFILGNNSNLKYGARLFDTFLGDNSTISCCEVLNNLIFPAHEQHHNNSFLIATLIMGQSNLAAGATIGSNHNSRANDNEIQAGRGFWPGLCSSVKHYSRFASYVLLAKADYPHELDIPLPFSLVNNNISNDQLEVMPAYWWLYNMYALVRNTWKFKNRDKRKNISRHIEFDFLAPDTIEEIIKSRQLLEIWTAKARLLQQGKSIDAFSEDDLIVLGTDLLSNNEVVVNRLEICGEHLEKSNRKVVIIKIYKAYHAYADMLHYYAVTNLVEYFKSNKKATLKRMNISFTDDRKSHWINLGGQLIPEIDVDQLRYDIRKSKLKSWDEIHNRYNELWEEYPIEKQKHAYALLCNLLNTNSISIDQWNAAIDKAIKIHDFINKQFYITRKKDFDNPFSQITFRNSEEMEAVNGKIDENVFIKKIQEENENYNKLLQKFRF